MHNYLLSDNFDKSTNITKATLSKDERYAILTGEFKNIAHITSMNQESFELVGGKLENISKELTGSSGKRLENTEIDTLIQNPRVARCKGRPPIRRKRSFYDGIGKKRNKKS